MAGIRIDALQNTILPSLEHEFPSMKDGQSVKLKVQQVADLVGGILGPDIAASLKYVRALGAAEDLNAIKEPGIYTQNQNAGASGGSNYPEALAGMLVVLPGGTSTNVRTVQLYVARSSPSRLHWRMESAADTWYGWANAFEWDAPLVSQAVAEAGTSADGNVKWSPLRVAQAIAARASPGLGVGQTWQDMTGSRVQNTTYQNTTGRPIVVNLVAYVNSSSRNYFEVSANGSTWINVGNTDSGGGGEVSVIVPASWYYRAGTGTYVTWAELR